MTGPQISVIDLDRTQPVPGRRSVPLRYAVAAVVLVSAFLLGVVGAYGLGLRTGLRALDRSAAGYPAGLDAAALADLIGQQQGRALAGNAPLVVSPAQARVLSGRPAPDAVVDTVTNRIVYASARVSLVAEASPPGGPATAFRSAGLDNPTIVVPRNAEVTVEFINADEDHAHGWEVTDVPPPFGFEAPAWPAFAGAAANMIGDPVPAGYGARILHFTATTAGSYQYICTMPGQAQLGMHGSFLVV